MSQCPEGVLETTFDLPSARPQPDGVAPEKLDYIKVPALHRRIPCATA